MWLGTDLVFDAFKFYIRETPYGVMQIHGYPFDASGSTFIVEMHDEVWQAAGFEAPALAPCAPYPGTRSHTPGIKARSSASSRGCVAPTTAPTSPRPVAPRVGAFHFTTSSATCR